MASQMGARWLAFTDADSSVAPNWLAAQLALDSDAVCETVTVSDWGAYGEHMRTHYAAAYTDADGHRHIHVANLDVSTAPVPALHVESVNSQVPAHDRSQSRSEVVQGPAPDDCFVRVY